MLRRTCWLLALLSITTSLSAQQTIYWKKDHIYNGPGGKEIAIATPAPGDQTAPTVPTSLASSSITATSVQLNWTGSTDSGGSGLAGYKIYRANLPVGTVGAGTTSFLDQPLVPSSSYSYSIVAFDSAQNHSGVSNAIAVTTLTWTGDTIPPSAPLQLTGRALDQYNVKLKWLSATDAGGSGLDVYQVKRGTSPTGLAVIATVTTSTLVYTDSTALQNTTYYFAIAAKDKAGNVGPDSNSVTVITPAETIPPTTPGNFSGSALSISSNRLTWSASTDSGGSGLAGYRVYSSGSLVSGANPITATTFDHTGLNRNTNYSYTVKAVDGVDNASNLAGPIAVKTLRYSGIDFQDNFNTVDGPMSASWSSSPWQIGGQRAAMFQYPVYDWVDTYTSTSYTYFRATLDLHTTNQAGLVFGVQDGVSSRWCFYIDGFYLRLYYGSSLVWSGSYDFDTLFPLNIRIDADSTTGALEITVQGAGGSYTAAYSYNVVDNWGLSASTLAGKVGIAARQANQFVDNFVVWR